MARYAATLIQKGRTDTCVELYKKYGAPVIPQNYNLYKQMAYDTLKLDSFVSSQDYNRWSDMRAVLFDLNKNMAKSATDKEGHEHKLFQKLMLIVHYNTMRCSCIGNEQMDPLFAKLSISLLRHVDVLPADKAFYEAGVACQKAKWDNMAFVFLNRYIDLADAIDEGTNEIMDNQYLTDTDIPTELNLPEQKYLSNEKHEDIKTWVITMSMNKKVEPSLNTDERGVYEASLVGPEGRSLPCVVTGYPVLEKRIDFKNNLAANTDDWNSYLMTARVSDFSISQFQVLLI